MLKLGEREEDHSRLRHPPAKRFVDDEKKHYRTKQKQTFLKKDNFPTFLEKDIVTSVMNFFTYSASWRVGSLRSFRTRKSGSGEYTPFLHVIPIVPPRHNNWNKNKRNKFQ